LIFWNSYGKYSCRFIDVLFKVFEKENLERKRHENGSNYLEIIFVIGYLNF
tara:strand:+ start:953 stop:1105 length:153 start_codon:yes stop_codon:yes gene_type:complete